MANNEHPFFKPEFVADLAPICLTPPTEPFLNNSKFLLPCAGSQLISALFGRLQEQALHLYHTLLLQAADTRFVDNRMVAYFPEPKASPAMLTPDERQRTLYCLHMVMTQVDIVVGPTAGTAGGMTASRLGRTFADFSGCGSTITIHPSRIQDINNAFANDQQMAQQIYIFEIAVLFIHELAHAIVFAVLPTGWGGNCFLGTGPTDEIGYEFESRLFGGLIHKHNGAIYGPQYNQCFDSMLVQREWPHPHTLDTYRKTSSFSTVLTQGPKMSRTTRLWRVPFSYINQMFLDDFWMLLPLKGVNGLHLYREKGIVVQALRPEDFGGRHMVQMFNAEGPEVRPHVPAGFMLWSHGMMTRVDTPSSGAPR